MDEVVLRNEVVTKLFEAARLLGEDWRAFVQQNLDTGYLLALGIVHPDVAEGMVISFDGGDGCACGGSCGAC